MKKSVYLDTTIPNYLFDQKESIKLDCERTRKWWDAESSKYEISVSPETIAEVKRGKYPHQQQVIEFVDQLEILDHRVEIPEIVDFYIAHKLVPQTASGDAVHLAFASLYKIDFLLTWNCTHLANGNKKQHIKVINARLDLPVPEILTPLELFGGDD